MKRILEWNPSFNPLLKNFLLERVLILHQYNSLQFQQELKVNLKIQLFFNSRHQFFQEKKDRTQLLTNHHSYLVNKVNHKTQQHLINHHSYLVNKANHKILLINHLSYLVEKVKYKILSVLKNKRMNQSRQLKKTKNNNSNLNKFQTLSQMSLAN